jgi:hypothetical protein
VSETACPFCGAAFDEAFRASLEPQGPRVRLARAALLAFGAVGSVGAVGALGAGVAALTTACSSSSSTPAYGAPAPTETAQPLYGAPATPTDAGDDGSTTTPEAGTTDATTDGPVATPAYGAPGQPVVDASDDQHVGVYPPYGIAPAYGAPAPPYGIAPVDDPGDLPTH